MGNSQSTSEKGAGAGQGEGQGDGRLRRFHTGASDAATTSSPSPTPPLRRTSTTATGSATEKRHASLGRSGASAISRGASGSASVGRKSGTVSATGSPRASEREKAWVRSATRRSSTMVSGDSATSPSRGRTRSGSISILLSGGSRGPTLHEDEVFDPHKDGSQPNLAKRAELTFRRKKSIELTDVLEPGLTMRDVHSDSGPSTPLGLPGRRIDEDPSSVGSPTSDSQQSSHLPSHLLVDNDSSPISGSPAGDHTLTADVDNPLFPPTSARKSNKDALGRSQPAAFPSYLKIPTLIPSTYASPSSSTPSSPSASDIKGWPVDDHPGANHQSNVFPAKLGGGGVAAAAILNTEDIVIKPGGASKASSPVDMHKALSPEDGDAETVQMEGVAEEAEEGDLGSTDGGAQGVPSRTPTPTPGNLRDARAMTPTGGESTGLSNLTSPAKQSSTAARRGESPSTNKRASLKVFTGIDSGANTPGLPIGLTSAPSSALTPQAIPTYNAENPGRENAAPLTKATNRLNMTPQSPQVQHKVQSQSQTGSNAVTPTAPSSHPPLMPITVKWRGGGKEVFVTGTFANEWRSKILLKKTAGSGKRAEYSCVLHLAPGTHRLKFIVDDRWRVSRDLSTASDGEGNLTNYIEVAHMGPAHPGPLSAPGEDLLVAEDEEVKKKKGQASSGIAAHKATLDLMEEARRAEALRRGDLLDVFGNEKVRKEERWTQEIPESIIKAQLAEEAYRTELEEKKPEPKHNRRESIPPSSVPVPPTLPRQLEKVILNSSPAAVAGAVDDTSVLPAPNHAVLHHLTASAIKSGVIATGCTMRYRKKYITTIYYRAAN